MVNGSGSYMGYRLNNLEITNDKKLMSFNTIFNLSFVTKAADHM